MTRLLLQALCFFLLVVAQTAAQPIVLVTGDWPPFVGQKLPGQGPVTVLVRKAFADAGLQVTINFTSWPLAERMVETGQAFAAFPYRYTAERALRYDFSVSMFEGRNVLFYNKRHHKHFPSLLKISNLSEFQIGALHGEWYVEPMKKAGLKLDFASSYEQTLTKLHAGRVDLAPMNEMLGWYFLHQMYPQDIEQFASTVVDLDGGEASGSHLIVSRAYADHAVLLNKVNQAINAMQQSGEIARIFKKAGMVPKFK